MAIQNQLSSKPLQSFMNVLNFMIIFGKRERLIIGGLFKKGKPFQIEISRNL